VQKKPPNIDSILAPIEMNKTAHLIAAVPFSSFSSLVVRKPEKKKEYLALVEKNEGPTIAKACLSLLHLAPFSDFHHKPRAAKTARPKIGAAAAIGPAAAPAVKTGPEVVDVRAPVPEAAPPVVVAAAVVVTMVRLPVSSELETLLLVSAGSRGPSQCQWSPCGSQPMDSVGLGPGSTTSVWSSSASEAVVAGSAGVVVVTGGGSSVAASDVTGGRGPSQCLLREIISALPRGKGLH
jgi:hypothetical protein